MSENNENVNIQINYRGQDITVCVNRNTANILLNDPVAAEQYVQNLIGDGSEDGNNETESQSHYYETESQSHYYETESQSHYYETESHSHYSFEDWQPDNTESQSSNEGTPGPDKVAVWTSKRPTEVDNTATKAFLKLREKYAGQFDDKKSRKNNLWNLIGNEMMEMGYYLGDSKKDVTEKLRQKFSNLQKQYLAYIKHVGTTGERRKEPPAFFEEMHSILGMKDKVHPQNLQDSLMEETSNSENIAPLPSTSSECSTSVAPIPSTSKVPCPSTSTEDTSNRFSNVERPRPFSINQMILKEIKAQHAENLEEKKQFYIIQKNLETQNKQRAKMLEQFDKFLEILGGKKRKRDSSDED